MKCNKSSNIERRQYRLVSKGDFWKVQELVTRGIFKKRQVWEDATLKMSERAARFIYDSWSKYQEWEVRE